MEMPFEIIDFITERQKGTKPQCQFCNSNCCNGPGFAILENVLNIYQRYTNGLLIRKDCIC